MTDIPSFSEQNPFRTQRSVVAWNKTSSVLKLDSLVFLDFSYVFMERNQKSDPYNAQDVERRARDVIDWFRRYPSALAVLLVFLFAILILPTTVFSVDRNEEAVVLRFGNFNRQLGPGLQYKFPYPIERAYLVQTRTQFKEQFGYREGGQAQTARRQRPMSEDEESLMLTGDLGVARVEWEVQYRKINPKEYLFNVDDRKVRTLIRQTSLATTRRIVGDKTVASVITTAREAIRNEVKNELQRVMDTYNTGIRIDDVEIQDTEPPVNRVIDAFKEVDSARQDREKFRNEALREKESVLNEVEGTVEKRISEAKGKAAEIRNTALGEAERFEHIVEQYKAAPDITKTRMFLETMQEVMQGSERVYVIDERVKGLLPHLQLKDDN